METSVLGYIGFLEFGGLGIEGLTVLRGLAI